MRIRWWRVSFGLACLGLAAVQAWYFLHVLFNSMHLASPLRMRCERLADSTLGDVCTPGLIVVDMLGDAMGLAVLNGVAFAVGGVILLLTALPSPRKPE
jgi:hypothetical protein